jgi:sulfotransferase
MKTFYFVSGMARSGSTLLQNILAQNPRFHCTHTSGCLDVLFGVRNSWSQLVEHQAHPDDAALLRVQKAILEAYYADVEKPVIFDKSRGWGAYAEMTETILGTRMKILVPIRNMPDVMASMEKLHRETSKTRQPPGEMNPNNPDQYFQMQTVAGRCEFWASGNQVVGIAYNRIKDAIRRGFRDRMHFVEFEKLTSEPQKTMEGIYAFLGEERFQHDFEKVEQKTTENDEVHGYTGLHTIHPKVTHKPSHAVEILGKDLAGKLAMMNLEF